MVERSPSSERRQDLGRSESFKSAKRSVKKAESIARKALLSWSDGEKQRQRRNKITGLFLAGSMAHKWAKRMRDQTESFEYWDVQVGSKSPHNLSVYRGAPGREKFTSTGEQKQGNLPFLIFHPYSSWRLLWDFMLLVLLLYSFITVPLFLAFVPAPSECTSGLPGRSSFFYFEFACDCVFMMDILISFRTAYFDGKSREILVTDSRYIAVHYMRGFFILDLASSMPYELLLSASCTSLNGANRFLRGPKIVKLIRLVRIMKTLRISKIRKFLEKIRDVLRLNPGVARLLKFLSLVCVLTHYNACIMFYIGELFIDPEELAAGTPVLDQAASRWISWTTSSKSMPGGSSTSTEDGLVSITELPPLQQYIVSVYWSVVTMTTVGYGDILPKTLPEFVFSTVVIIQGGVTFSWIVGNLATLLSKINIRYTKYKQSVEHWEDFFYAEQVPIDLQHDIRKYKAFLYVNPVRKMPMFATTELSPSLRRDLNAHLYTRFLGRMPMFKGLHERDLTEIALLLEPKQFSPGEVIYREGHWDDCMYFVHSGSVDMSMLLLNNDVKRKRQIHLITDPSIAEMPTFMDYTKDPRGKLRRGRASDLTGSLVWRGLGDIKPSFFHWSISSKTKAFFGENVLHNESQIRLASAVSEAWTTVFKLRKEDLDRLVHRFPEIKKVYKRLQLQAAPCALKRVALKIIHARRLLIKERARINVKIEAATKLPAFDRRFGRCDPYCVVELSPKTQTSPQFRTLVSRNTRYPEWNELFTYFFSQRSDAMAERKLLVKVYDYDAAGDDQLLGFSYFDLTPLINKAINENNYGQEGQWLDLTRSRPRKNPFAILKHWFFPSGPQVKVIAEVVLGPLPRRRSSLGKSSVGSFNTRTSEGPQPLIPSPTPRESGVLSQMCYSPWSLRGRENFWKFIQPKVQMEVDDEAATRKSNAERMMYGLDGELARGAVGSPIAAAARKKAQSREGSPLAAASNGVDLKQSEEGSGRYNTSQVKQKIGGAEILNQDQLTSRRKQSLEDKIRLLEKETQQSVNELGEMASTVETIKEMLSSAMKLGSSASKTGRDELKGTTPNSKLPMFGSNYEQKAISTASSESGDIVLCLPAADVAVAVKALQLHGSMHLASKLHEQLTVQDRKQVKVGDQGPQIVADSKQCEVEPTLPASHISQDVQDQAGAASKAKLKPLPRVASKRSKRGK